MSRIRIEGLLAAFPKLVGSGSKSQHTFIETDSVRYVYQPIETLFLLLITNKASNIVEDLETLRLLSKVIPEISGGLSEEKIGEKMFELVFAFDEVLTAGGHRESISMSQIQTNLLMESHEEKLHKMIQESKVSQAKEEADRKAKALRDERRAAKMAGIGGGPTSGLSGIEGGGGGNLADTYGDSHMSGGSNTGGSFGGSDDRTPASSGYGDSGGYGQSTPAASAAPSLPKKGMQLGGGGSKKLAMMDKLVTEDNLTPLAGLGGGAAASHAPSPKHGGPSSHAPAEVPDAAPVMIAIEEKVSAALNREGALESLDVKGTMQLTATQDDSALCKVVLGGSGRNPAFTYQTHPKVDKKAYEAGGTLALKDASKGFPKGKSVGVLRWSMSTTSEDEVPISINCWPEPDGAEMNVNVEYSCEKAGMELHDVQVVIPLGTAAAPNVLNCDSGTTRHNRGAEELVWELAMIDGSNKTASLEFNVPQKDGEAFFPIQVGFRSMHVLAGVDVGTVVHSASGAPLQYSVTKSVTTDSYKVE